MKRTNKKLSLKSETLRSLTPTEMGEAGGAGLVFGPIIIKPSVIIACLPVTTTLTTGGSAIDACPSALGCTTSIVINPYVIKY